VIAEISAIPHHRRRVLLSIKVGRLTRIPLRHHLLGSIGGIRQGDYIFSFGSATITAACARNPVKVELMKRWQGRLNRRLQL
jgi:hypothetical protein